MSEKSEHLWAKDFFDVAQNAAKLTFGFQNVLRKRNFLASSKFTIAALQDALRDDLKMVETHPIFGRIK